MKIGIVGTGNISSRHFNEFNNIENVNVEAVCDTNQNNLNKFLLTHNDKNIRGYSSLEEMLEKENNFDGISNTTPDKFHKATTLQILEKGYNVFCEKPLAENYKDAKHMVDAALKSKKINMVNFTYRESSAYQQLVKRIKSGELGIPRHVSACYYQSWLTSNKWGKWQEEKNGYGDFLLNMEAMVLWVILVYIFLILLLMQSATLKKFLLILKHITIKEKNKDYILDANDGFNSLVRFENGAIGTITNSRYATGHANHNFRSFCTKGSAKVELMKKELNGPLSIFVEMIILIKCYGKPLNAQKY